MRSKGKIQPAITVTDDIGYVYETDDSGAFYSCGQEATSYVQRGNIIRGNTFRHVRMRDEIHLGNPVVQGVRLFNP